MFMKPADKDSQAIVLLFVVYLRMVVYKALGIWIVW